MPVRQPLFASSAGWQVGGGNGTAALGILRWLEREVPDTFRRCRYVSLEVSERLARAQSELLRAAGVPAERFEAVLAPPGQWM